MAWAYGYLQEATVTVPPEYSEEVRMREGPEVTPVIQGPIRKDVAEEELDEHAREEEELDYLDPERNEAHAPGAVCERCGAVITATQDARRRPDGRWVHEECPPQT
jgi:hypothetical protein